MAGENLTCSCDCFGAAILLSKPKSKRLKDYIESEQKKLEYFLKEVYKHTTVNVGQSKSCYEAVNTVGLVLMCSYFRHQKSIKKLETVLKKKKTDLQVQLLNGSVVPVQDYLKIVKKLVVAFNDSVRILGTPTSTIQLKFLIKSEYLHKNTLKLLQHVNQLSEHSGDEMGPLNVTSIGVHSG